MKKLLFTSVLFCLVALGKAQTGADTLYTSGNKKIPCKIVEIGETEIKYKTVQNPDGPVYVINITKVQKYTLANGYTERVIPDELSVENQHAGIMNNRSVIKVQPFSFINNQVSIAYEQVIQMGMNLDVELGYINTNLTPSMNNANMFTTTGSKALCTGFYIKPGVKFMLGQDYSLKGMKYAHPLKGRYIKLDLAFSTMNFQDVASTQYNYNTYPNPPTYVSTVKDITTFAYGGFVNYGRQFILGNILTLEYYVGLGFSGQTSSSKNVTTSTGTYPGGGYPYPYYYSQEAKYLSNYHGFFRETETGLSATFGFRIGYIIPSNPKPAAKH